MKSTTSRTRASRGLALAAATGITVGSLLMGATAADAATLQRATFADRVEFLGNENNADVGGRVRFTVRPDGDWNIFAPTRNGRPAFRHVRWTCDLQVAGATIRAETDPVRIKRKSSHTFDVSGNDVAVAALYDTIATDGGATCDVHFGK
jgi:hypothetical protein